MRKPGAVLCLIVAFGGSVNIKAEGQSQARRTTSEKKATRPSESEFTCPDPLAVEACKSFAELYKAGDEGVRTSGIAYACFREGGDEFFIVEVSRPSFSPGSFSPGDITSSPGWGTINAFAHGIRSLSILPIFFFRGTWTGPFSPTFEATAVNRQKEIADPNLYGVSLDPEQFNAAWKYKNRSERDIDYSLTIQLSTGRFSESFIEEPSKSPFLEGNGRCLQLPSTATRQSTIPK